MVCLVAPVLKEEMVESKESDIQMISEDVAFDDNLDDEYSLVRLAGGRLVDHPPLITPNGKYILIIYYQKVLMYSTSTGEWIRDFEESGKSPLVSIEVLLNDPRNLVGCSTKGEITIWDLKNGSISRRSRLPINGVVKTFTLLNMLNGLFSLITYRNQENRLKWDIVNMQENTLLNCPLDLNLNDSNDDIITTAETNLYHYFVIAQRQNLLVVNYRTWRFKLWKNALKCKITAVQVHPTELLVATGDENGKIFLYRDIFKFNGDCHSTLYHWHHNPVTSIAFTLSGSGFYSGGYEAVLVKWNIDRPDLRNYLPRMSGHICHIVVGDRNRKIAISTADNGVQILNDQLQLICTLQNFTFVFENKCEQNQLPVGLLLNPVNNSLVSNGRYGHLQFFSTHTKSLLYNIDVVMQNKLSTEAHKILYDTVVTRAALNVNWIATGELWDDEEHVPELRLKFWEYKKQNQTYSLNTSIELPHEGGIKAIKFSSSHSADNLLCATLGNDAYIKTWSLEIIESIRKKRQIWLCVAKTKYKDYNASSIDFSSDGSLLSATYGNTLCIFKAVDLKLKAALTAPPVYDGSFHKVQIYCNEKKNNITEVDESYKKILDVFKNFEEDAGNKAVVKILQKTSIKSRQKIMSFAPILQSKNNKILFKKVLQIPELNLFQKLVIFQKLNMQFAVSPIVYPKIIEYINSKLNKNTRETQLRNYTTYLSSKCKFKAKYKLSKYYLRQNVYQNKVNETLIPLLDMLRLEDNNSNLQKNVGKTNCNGFSDNSLISNSEEVKRKKVDITKKLEDIPNNLQGISEVKTVNFGKGEFAHLIIITTEYRVIIWNILTLRIQFVLKLSVKVMAVDEITSLCAAFTCNNELFVFLPNAPLYLYRRAELPEINSACWVPRKHPKATSLNLDWQSLSTLYFLTGMQEIVYLSTTKDKEAQDSVAFVNDPNEITQHSIFDAHSFRKTDKKAAVNLDTNIMKIGVPGNAEIKSIIQMAPHASAPMNLLCSNFIQSLLLKRVQDTERIEKPNLAKTSKSESDTDNETDELFLKIKERQKLFNNVDSFDKVENLHDKKFNSKQLKKTLQEILPDTIEF
ncbi:WD repeat-containing protein 75 [Condylostylus longicornis]|uniref:WD repeat-containing protein 75 n=1 Tax=Condylostylus longicornis TaxID=2530218 RepID=UPI00244E4AEA|nr:WD repeat-containing protein 75 [Condylostylus longicornis]